MISYSWIDPELPFLHSVTVAGRSRSLGYEEARPVAVPDDVDDPRYAKAAGVVTLPENVRWSGPPKSYDLGVPADRNRVYEQVLREGTDDDVRRFIDVDVLVEAWDELVLPARVRRAWVDWFRRHRGAEPAC